MNMEYGTCSTGLPLADLNFWEYFIFIQHQFWSLIKNHPEKYCQSFSTNPVRTRFLIIRTIKKSQFLSFFILCIATLVNRFRAILISMYRFLTDSGFFWCKQFWIIINGARTSAGTSIITRKSRGRLQSSEYREGGHTEAILKFNRLRSTVYMVLIVYIFYTFYLLQILVNMYIFHWSLEMHLNGSLLYYIAMSLHFTPFFS